MVFDLSKGTIVLQLASKEIELNRNVYTIHSLRQLITTIGTVTVDFPVSVTEEASFFTLAKRFANVIFCFAKRFANEFF